MERIFIVAAKRTPIGSFNGSLASLSSVELGAHAIKAALEQVDIAPEQIDEVIVGNVLTGGAGMGPGRQAAMKAGIPESVPAYTLNMICGSGMKAIMDAVSHIRAGDARIVMTCGMESMSNAAFLASGNIRQGIRMGHQVMEDSIIKDGLTDAFHGYHMGITAENIAKKFDISREQQDEFALNSQRKAAIALKDGHFNAEIAPVSVSYRKQTQLVEQDEFPKLDCTLEDLQNLRPAFDKQGTVTAGNASGINDGASAILLACESAVEQYGLTPLAEVVEYAQAGVDPEFMGLGPVSAVGHVLEKSRMKLTDIEVFELNEAFAAQAIGVNQQLASVHHIEPSWLEQRVNLSGGAIALGHPIGASGNRIVTTLVYQLERTQLTFGLASLCIGGGMGTALIIKRC